MIDPRFAWFAMGASFGLLVSGWPSPPRPNRLSRRRGSNPPPPAAKPPAPSGLPPAGPNLPSLPVRPRPAGGRLVRGDRDPGRP